MRFRVLVHGSNLELHRDGQRSRLGFYATRYVDAHNAESARKAVIEGLWQEEQIGARINTPSSPLRIDVEEIEEVGAQTQHSGSGFTFYELEDADDASDGEETSREVAYRIEKEAHREL